VVVKQQPLLQLLTQHKRLVVVTKVADHRPAGGRQCVRVEGGRADTAVVRQGAMEHTCHHSMP
jgi:hypothetical protein